MEYVLVLGGFVGFVFLLFWIPFQAAAGNKVAEWIARVSVVVFVIGVVGAISGFVYLAATQESDGDPGPSEAESRIAQEWEIIEGQLFDVAVYREMSQSVRRGYIMELCRVYRVTDWTRTPGETFEVTDSYFPHFDQDRREALEGTVALTDRVPEGSVFG